MANYLARVAGRIQEVVATVTGGTATQAGAILALDSTGRVDSSVMPVGIAADQLAGTAGGALTAGDFVAVTSAGIVRASAASGGTQADGYTLSSSSNGAAAVALFEGTNTGLTGLTVGTRYYLSDTTAGGLTSTPVSGTGKLHQYLGKAITTTSLSFEPDDSIILA